MKNADYNMSLWILNIPYICLALPSNLLMKKGFVEPRVYLSGLMFCWGKSRIDRGFCGKQADEVLIAMCTIGLGLSRSFKGVLVCRFLMGCLEAGFVPGIYIFLIELLGN